jgi:hypothetical protein
MDADEKCPNLICENPCNLWINLFLFPQDVYLSGDTRKSSNLIGRSE